MISTLAKTVIGRFRIIAFIEGCSYLLIGITMILKYKYMMPGPNYVVGMVHGVLFLLYIILLIQVWIKYKWPFMRVFFSFVASLIPFGTFYADSKIFKNQAD